MKPSNTTTSGKATDMIAGICALPRLPCPCTKWHVMLNLTSTGVCNTGTSALCVTCFFDWHGGGCCCTEPSKSNEYEYEKEHLLRRDSKMCCCCCRFCCGAPTTDERIHAPVLHDASQITYCRYWGRASLPPNTSMGIVGLTRLSEVDGVLSVALGGVITANR